MKYIRTKDGRIIDLSDCELDDETEECYYYIQHDDEYGFEIRKNNILNQADTIPELCDRFVTLSKYTNRHYVYLILKGAINKRKELPFEVCEIYGAIWTDKGLIYVAKMKGVLPNGEIDWELL